MWLDVSPCRGGGRSSKCRIRGGGLHRHRLIPSSFLLRLIFFFAPLSSSLTYSQTSRSSPKLWKASCLPRFVLSSRFCTHARGPPFRPDRFLPAYRQHSILMVYVCARVGFGNLPGPTIVLQTREQDIFTLK